MASSSFYGQISANRRNSFLLALLVVVLLGALGFSIGYVLFGTPAGGVATTLFAIVPRWAVRHRSRTSRATSSSWPSAAARAVDATSAPAADERRPGDGDRGQHPDADGLHHRRHGAERLRDRTRSRARLDRDHDGPAREARPRGAPGRHRPRALARPQPRHPVLARGRGDGRGDRDPRRLLPPLHVLGRGGPVAQPRQQRGRRRRPGDHLRHRDRARDPRAAHQPASSSSPSAASASTSPTPRRSS